MKPHKTDLCIIGAGPAGLSIASVAGQLGLKTALFETGHMGGDCLNHGCVPSKTMLHLANQAFERRQPLPELGLAGQPSNVDFQAVYRHIQRVIEQTGQRDSQARFEALGVDVYRCQGRFVSPRLFESRQGKFESKRFVIATGSRPFIPPIPELNAIHYETNETIFQLSKPPKHLMIIGGGPIGCELAQAHRRLGCDVTLIERHQLLPRDEPECVAYLRNQLISDGVRIVEKAAIEAVNQDHSGTQVALQHQGSQLELTGSHLLVATGRQPNIEELGLEQASVSRTAQGITTNQRLRTTNRRIYAAGDVTGRYQFTHAAAYHAGVVIKNALFKLPAKINDRALPWVTYTTPELAHVGLTEAQAKARNLSYTNVTLTFDHNDRFVIEGQATGLIKAIVTPKGHVLGASIVGVGAQELLTPWIMACQHQLKLKAFAELIIPYPTKSELVKQVANAFYSKQLFSPSVKKLVHWLSVLS